ncbi:MAG: MarR family transcriptional regulator [Terrimicrobiaceae bacterium]
MPYLMLKEVPRYECLQAAVARVPGADPAICQVFLNILHTGDVVSRGEAAFLARHGLSQARLIVLVLLDSSENGSMRSSELAEHADVSRATITGLLDSLEKSGLIARTPDTRDRRASCVRITGKGEALLRTVQPLLFRWTESVLSALSARERGQLVALLRKTQRAFSNCHSVFQS